MSNAAGHFDPDLQSVTEDVGVSVYMTASER